MAYRLGLLGHSISYSLSPMIFQWALQTCGLEGRYEIYDVAEEALPSLIGARNWDGLNVTVPYKSLAFTFCTQIEGVARQTGAVNTMHRMDGQIAGDNTDVLGFRHTLSSYQEQLSRARSALIIGSGGAARAVLWTLSRDFPSLELNVASRDPERARERMTPLQMHDRIRFYSLERASMLLPHADLVVQATPVGSHSEPGLPLPMPLSFAANSLVIDLIYAPRQTIFLHLAQAGGARTQNGLMMLIAQAAASFKIWTDHEFPLDRALHELLPQLSAVV